jgi:hypothetical protein
MQPEGQGDETGRGQPEGRLGAGRDLVRVGLYFYGAMMAAALLWRMGLHGESILHAGPGPDAGAIHWARDAGLGLIAGLFVVGVSAAITRFTDWGEALARALGGALVGIGVRDALLLAVASGLAEELFFRGALQPRVGLVLASLIFGAVHLVPRREMLPWTGFAVGAGLLFGALFLWTGNVVAPVVAHIVVNAVNLPLLIRDYAGEPRA